MKRANSLPILMYHYINRCPGPIAITPERFEEQCATLANNGWRGVSLEEAEEYLIKGENLPDKSVLFTFDDGFLDNYVYAWPILEKYGHKGVICAVAGKVENGQARSSSADLSTGKIKPEDLPSQNVPNVDQPFVTHKLGYKVRCDPFINWEEAQRMEKSGVVKIIPHSLNHRSVFAGPEYSGICIPSQRNRTFDRIDSSVPWGLPSFKSVPALGNRAFKISEEFIAAIKELVPQDTEEAFSFFAQAEAQKVKEKLHSLYAKWEGRMGHLESVAEREERTRTDFLEAKEIIEKGLGHPVRSFCWPWGAYDELSLRIGQECGFKVFFTTKIGANPLGQALEVKRFKAKDKPGSWLQSRCRIYSSPFWSDLYKMVRGRAK